MKKIISLLLVVAMLASLGVCCFSASAEEADKAANGINIAELVAKYGKDLDLNSIATIISAFNSIKESGVSLDPQLVALVVSALASKTNIGEVIDINTVKALYQAVVDMRANGFDISSDSLKEVVKRLGGGESYAQIRRIICDVTGNYPFKDIANVYPDLRSGIVEAYYMGLVDGAGDGYYLPNHAVTRAQFVTMLYRAAGEPAVSGTLRFTDSAKIATYYRAAVMWGVKNGIVQGCSDNTFRPDTPISRAQMATFMYRYMLNVEHYDFGLQKPVLFLDRGKIDSWYFDAVKAICSEGIMSGVGGDKFDPNGTANRAMAATVLVRMCNVLFGK